MNFCGRAYQLILEFYFANNSTLTQKVDVLLAANYFERSKPQMIADRTGITPVVVPMSVGGEPGVDSYFDLVDLWVERLKDAYAGTESSQ
mgnify:CR=1 FL=1